jgi:hypothetical protein
MRHAELQRGHRPENSNCNTWQGQEGQNWVVGALKPIRKILVVIAKIRRILDNNGEVDLTIFAAVSDMRLSA